MEGERAERIHAIVYSCDSREELAQRIVALEDKAEKQKIKLEVLKAHGIEIVDAVGGGHEIYNTRQREVDRLEYENAKLRELVLEIWRSCPVSEDDCVKCQHRIEESDEDWCDIPILMEKLGVEAE